MRPNLILLTVECFRGDHLGALTPNLSRFAEGAVSFLDAHAAGGWTRISLTALLSSAYASRHGGAEVALAAPGRKTLAECLLDKGYWTAGLCANPSGGGIIGAHRGFGYYRDVRRTPNLPLATPRLLCKSSHFLCEKGISPREAETFVNARELTNNGLEWLSQRQTGENWFLWLHYHDPHWPCQMAYEPGSPKELREAWSDLVTFYERVRPARGAFDPGPEAGERWVKRYRESLTAVDREIGILLEQLRGRPDWNQTIIALAGDHGEELFERGTWHHSWNQLHREGTHVPLIVRLPGSPPWSCGSPVGLLDLTPTLLDYMGIEQPDAMIGQSLRPAIEQKRAPGRPVYVEMTGHPNSALYRLAIRDDEWKYIYDAEDPLRTRLFHVPDDPGERRNLREECPGVFRRFEQMRLAHMCAMISKVRELDNTGSAEAGVCDPVLREQLEALGYI